MIYVLMKNQFQLKQTTKQKEINASTATRKILDFQIIPFVVSGTYSCSHFHTEVNEIFETCYYKIVLSVIMSVESSNIF